MTYTNDIKGPAGGVGPVGVVGNSDTGIEQARQSFAPHITDTDDAGVHTGGHGPILPVRNLSWPWAPTQDQRPAASMPGDDPTKGHNFRMPEFVRKLAARSRQENRNWAGGPLTGSPTDPVNDPQARGVPIEPANEAGRAAAGPNSGRAISSAAQEGQGTVTKSYPGTDQYGGPDVMGEYQGDVDTASHDALRVFRASAPWVPVRPIPFSRSIFINSNTQATTISIPDNAVVLEITTQAICYVSFQSQAFIPTIIAIGNNTQNYTDGIMSVFPGYVCGPWNVKGKKEISIISPSTGTFVNFNFFIEY